MITVSVPPIVDTDALEARIASRADVRLVPWSLQGPPSVPARDLDAVVLPFHTTSATPNPGYVGPTELAALAAAESVRLVQLLSIGAEGVGQHLPPAAALCNAVGVMERQTAELAVALVLASQRDLAGFVRRPSTGPGRWDNRRTPGLAGARVLLVGHGGIGSLVECMLEPFGVAVTRVAGSGRTLPDGRVVHAPDALPVLAADADVVVVTLPLTELTRGLIGTEVLAAMPDGALLVNVGRGPVVDTDALLVELRTGRLRAALDVTDPEPLPDDHALWRLDGVIVTPHVGGNTELMPRLLLDLVADQLVRLDCGLPLENIVEEPR
ncbi:NAD(P)-dependent oxidoreductase [Curtobacterium pusillum]|uniref:NAD(P)-dependent oxidoreductase n=1 Tax=Curtobacterium pusillum TaxID=69373 RepID=UPI0038142D0F